VHLAATHVETLKVVPLEVLRLYASEVG
jgi:hypothetical protein